MERKWFVFYTKSRQEKKVDELLQRRGYESFLPLHSQLRQWSDRKKKVLVPLFNSYIFVNVFEHDVANVVQLPGIAWSIRHNGKPATLQANELVMIKRFIETGWLVDAEAYQEEIQLGEQVKVIDGPLKGTIGRLTHLANSSRLGVLLESIGQVITVEIDRNAVRKLTDKEINRAPILSIPE